MRAMIAMSGGVNSSVAALLMKEAGYDCTGVTMRLYRDSGYPTSCEKSCCSDADEEYAALACWQLGIAHESICFSKSFEQAVIRRFIREADGLSVSSLVACLIISFRPSCKAERWRQNDTSKALTRETNPDSSNGS